MYRYPRPFATLSYDQTDRLLATLSYLAEQNPDGRINSQIRTPDGEWQLLYVRVHYERNLTEEAAALWHWALNKVSSFIADKMPPVASLRDVACYLVDLMKREPDGYINLNIEISPCHERWHFLFMKHSG